MEKKGFIFNGVLPNEQKKMGVSYNPTLPPFKKPSYAPRISCPVVLYRAAVIANTGIVLKKYENKYAILGFITLNKHS